MSSAATVFGWFSLAASLGIALFGLVARGTTAAGRVGLRGCFLMGVGLAMGNRLWDQVGLPEDAAFAINIVGSVVVVLGVYYLVRAQNAERRGNPDATG